MPAKRNFALDRRQPEGMTQSRFRKPETAWSNTWGCSRLIRCPQCSTTTSCECRNCRCIVSDWTDAINVSSTPATTKVGIRMSARKDAESRREAKP